MKYFLFDLDGTITNSKEGITKSVNYALNSFGIFTEDLDTLCTFIGPPLKESFKRFYNFTNDDLKNVIKKYREYYETTGLYENETYIGIDNLLKNLKKQGNTIILATAKPTVFAVKILEYFNLIQYFDFIAGSELDGTRCKKTDVISYVLKENNISDLKNTIMIGDRKDDILGAKDNKISSIGVLYGYGSLEEITSSNPNYIVNTIEELSNLLLNSLC